MSEKTNQNSLPKIEIESTPGFYTATGYRSARMSTSDGLNVSQMAGDALLQYDRPTMIDQSRYFYRNNAIYNGMIKRAVSYIVGNGFKIQPTTVSKEWNDKAGKLWAAEQRRPEIRGLLTGSRVDKMICREIIIAGDMGIIKTKQKKLQLIEAEQITGPGRLVDGIKKNRVGKPIAYYVAPYNRGGMINRSKAIPINPKEFIFITDPDRPSSTRGVPVCQAAFAMLHRINDICDSEAIAWQLLSRMAIAVTREEGPEIGKQESTADPNAKGTELADRITEIGYALIFQALPGEKVEGIDRNLPGANFTESIRMFLRLLGLPLGLPLEIILLDWTQSNYSQSRAVLEQAYQTFLDYQEILEEFYYREVYAWRVRQWIAAGKLKDRRDKYSHEWIKPTWPWIDQLKEAQAYGMKVDRGFTTHTAVCKSLNIERDDVVALRKLEVADAIKQAQAIEIETGVLPPWEIFAGLDPYKSKDTKEKETAAVLADNDKSDQKPGDKKNED